MTAHSPRAPSPPSGAGGDKRARILDAAEKIFARRGFFHARVSEIAREAGVADGTIYLYFKNKDDLLISLFESRMERVTAELTAALERVGPRPADRLTGFFATYARLVVAHPELAEVLTVELRQSSKFMKEYQNPRFSDFLKLLAGLIADGQEQGEFDSSLPAPIAARAIFGMLDELALAWLLGRGEKFDIVRAADALGALVLRGLERRST
jgi:TetR/AcrR family transcriptional regulator, fatty acid metabolism regulator protein